MAPPNLVGTHLMALCSATAKRSFTTPTTSSCPPKRRFHNPDTGPVGGVGAEVQVLCLPRGASLALPRARFGHARRSQRIAAKICGRRIGPSWLKTQRLVSYANRHVPPKRPIGSRWKPRFSRKGAGLPKRRRSAFHPQYWQGALAVGTSAWFSSSKVTSRVFT